MSQSQLNLEDLQLESILYRYGSPEAELSTDTFENVRNLRDACLAMARQGHSLAFFVCLFSMQTNMFIPKDKLHFALGRRIVL